MHRGGGAQPQSKGAGGRALELHFQNFARKLKLGLD